LQLCFPHCAIPGAQTPMRRWRRALTSLPQIIEFDQAQDEAPMGGADRSQAPDAADK
jgi:hypothetical protein